MSTKPIPPRLIARILALTAEQAEGWSIVKWSTFILLLNFVTSFFAISLFMAFNVQLPEQLEGIEHIDPYFAITFVSISVFGEELLFRFPLALAVRKWGISNKVLIASVISSIIFGAIHGSIFNVFIQGVVGLSYCFLFLKCGGFSGKFIKALLIAWIVHALYDILLLILVFTGS